MGSMLRTLRHGFLKEALDFAGVHRERLAEVCKTQYCLNDGHPRRPRGSQSTWNIHERNNCKHRPYKERESLWKTYSYRNSSRSICISLLLIGQKIFSGQSRFVHGIQNLSRTCGFRRFSRSTCKLCQDYASHGLRERQPMQEKTFFFSFFQQ